MMHMRTNVTLDNDVENLLRKGYARARRVVQGGTAGNLTSDAHLAALAIEHGATMLTFDRDFSRFAGLQWDPPTDWVTEKFRLRKQRFDVAGSMKNAH